MTDATTFREHTYGEDCWCNGPPIVHEDDSYGSCVTCREYIHHTDDEWRSVPFPCPAARLADAEADAKALYEALKDATPCRHVCAHRECQDAAIVIAAHEALVSQRPASNPLDANFRERSRETLPSAARDSNDPSTETEHTSAVPSMEV